MPSIPLSAKIGAGAIAGVLGTTIIFPLDVAKSVLQSRAGGTFPWPLDQLPAGLPQVFSRAPRSAGCAAATSAPPSPPGARVAGFQNPFAVMRELAAKEGISRLFRGALPPPL